MLPPQVMHQSPAVGRVAHADAAGQQPPAHALLMQLARNMAQLYSVPVRLPPHCCPAAKFAAHCPGAAAARGVVGMAARKPPAPAPGGAAAAVPGAARAPGTTALPAAAAAGPVGMAAAIGPGAAGPGWMPVTPSVGSKSAWIEQEACRKSSELNQHDGSLLASVQGTGVAGTQTGQSAQGVGLLWACRL